MYLAPDEAAGQLFTLRDWLRYAVSRFEQAGLFFGHGTANSYDEAVWLTLASLHLPHDTLDNFLDAVLTAPERRQLAHLIERRVSERVPVAYLVREAWLGDFRFYVDERVIVPRSFIAELLREQLAPWIEHPEEVVAVADICTGSGCLAIHHAIAQFFGQFGLVDRLGEIVVHACSDAGLAITLHGIRRHGDDWGAREIAFFLHGADRQRGCETVHHRHLHVHQHNVKTCALAE